LYLYALTAPWLARLAYLLACLALAGLLAACGGGGSGADATPPGGLNSAVVEAAPNTATPSLITTTINLDIMGYDESEYFLAGTARSYTSSAPLSVDGKWSVAAAGQGEYKTRMVVYKPKSAAKFNGTVIVEWLNVSVGADTAVDWVMAHNELIRSGYAYVGVSAQKTGVDTLKASSRYAALSHPGDSYSYDIFSQAAKAVLKPQGINPLAGLTVQKMIAAGESQSANRLMTYANAFGTNRLFGQLFDGFFIHSRTYPFGAALSQAPQTAVPTPDGLTVRDDLPVPTMMLQTEYDVYKFSSAAARQDDTPKFRLWEVAGTSHVDYYTVAGRADYGIDNSYASVLESKTPLNCSAPVNSGPQHFVVSAAFAALRTWIADGTAPSIAPRIEVSGTPLNVLKDALGNAKGGIRTPYVDAPVATLSADGQPSGDTCTLFGTTKLFDSTLLNQLYSSHEDYVAKVEASVSAAVAKGFLLRADAAMINLSAQNSSVGVR
jgi:hypothetical protein